MSGIRNLVDAITSRGLNTPDKPLYTFLKSGDVDGEAVTISYGEMLQASSDIACHLRHLGFKDDDRVMMLYPPGLEFIKAFLGCLLVGVIPVPVYPPSMGKIFKSEDRLRKISVDAGIAGVMTCGEWLKMQSELSDLSSPVADLPWIASDRIERQVTGKKEGSWEAVEFDGSKVAYLQYTSGSTGAPKGVVVTHGSLAHTLADLSVDWLHDSDSCMISWLPCFHDLGLIYGVLHPLFVGYQAVLMAPAAFVQKPRRWLQAVSRFRGTHTAAPNFAYELCLNKVTDAERDALDLRSLKIMMNAAEPIRVATLKRFNERFVSCGLGENVLSPSYGMAEASLKASTPRADEAITLLYVAAGPWGEGRVEEVDESNPRAKAIVGCGRCALGMEARIVDPDSCTELPDGRVGEIWLAGKSIAAGYWQNEEKTKEIFGAHIHGTGEGPYLRTGDLGFIKDKQIFFATREKDLIIVRGRNHYPQDIELCVERSSELIVSGGSAAFELDADLQTVCVVAEVNAVKDPANSESKDDVYRLLCEKIRRDVLSEHGIDLSNIVLIRSKTIAKTSSGKIQRKAAKAEYLGNRLRVCYEWQSCEGIATKNSLLGLSIKDQGARKPFAQQLSVATSITAVEIQALIKAEIQAVHRDGEKLFIDPDLPFSDYGLDSKLSVGVSGDLSEKLGIDLAPTVLYDYPCLSQLADYLVERLDGPAAPRDSAVNIGEAGSDVDPVANSQMGDNAEGRVAIIGIGCRYPGGVLGLDDFWSLLEGCGDGVGDIPLSRWDNQKYYDPKPSTPGKTYAGCGGFIEDVDRFDAAFFGISPVEAASMDPQQRLVMEVAWEALENAGIDPDTLKNTDTGVFIGVSHSDYEHRTLASGDSRLVDAYSASGIARSVFAGRLSYFMDLKGPSLTIDTACSSSLVAIITAAENIRDGKCSVAIAGGVNLILSPSLQIYFSQIGALASDGRCKTFADNADGYVRSEGCGVLILKKLSEAERDGDRVLAVIEGGAVNQDGKTHGLTAPSRDSQAELIGTALANSGLKPDDIQYVEAHGTGTPLGDSVELSALDDVFTGGRPDNSPLYVGSVKTNIGHCEAAAGVAGVIKTVLMLRNRKIVQSINRQRDTKTFAWGDSSLALNRELVDWPLVEDRSYAGVSAFGFSGTNAHLILSDYREALPAASVWSGRGELLLPLSAASKQALAGQVEAYIDYLDNALEVEASIADTCVSGFYNRKQHRHRLAVVGESQADIMAALADFKEEGASPNVLCGEALQADNPVVFVFPGQGHQWIGMARDLIKRNQVFRETINRCHEALKAHVSWSLLAELDAGQEQALLKRVDVVQPVIFSVQVALARVWESWGIKADAVVGHSLGEIAAAHIAGALSLEDAVKIVCIRSRLISTLDGAMALIGLDQEGVKEICRAGSGLEISAYNGTEAIVVSGTNDSISRLVAECEREDIFCKRVDVDFASHSRYVEPVIAALVQELHDIRPGQAAVPIISSVCSDIVDGQEMGAQYWGDNLRRPVRFAQSIDKALEAGYSAFVEVSGHPTLLDGIDSVAASQGKSVKLFNSLKRDEDGNITMLRSLANLHCCGFQVRLDKLVAGSAIDYRLPLYCWDRSHFWLEAAPDSSKAMGSDSRGHGVLGCYTEVLSSHPCHAWAIDVESGLLDIFNDHQVGCMALLPATAYVDTVLAAFRDAGLGNSPSLSLINFSQLITLKNLPVTPLQLVIENVGGMEYRFAFKSKCADSGEVTLYCHGLINNEGGAAGKLPSFPESMVLTDFCKEDIYAYFDRMNLNYGRRFQGLEKISFSDNGILGEVVNRDPSGFRGQGFIVNPVVFDMALHAMVAEDLVSGTDPVCRIPISFDRVNVYGALGERCFVHVTKGCKKTGSDARVMVRDVAIYDEQQELLVEVSGVSLLETELDLFGAQNGASLLDISWEDAVAGDQPKHAAAAGDLLVVHDADEEHPLVGAVSAFRTGAKQVRMKAIIDGSDDALTSSIEHIVVVVGDTEETIAPANVARDSVVKLMRLFPLLTGLASNRNLTLSFVFNAAFTETGSDGGSINMASRSTWGFVAAAASEYPQLNIKLINTHGAERRDWELVSKNIGQCHREQFVWIEAGKKRVAALLARPVPTRINAFEWREGKSQAWFENHTHLISGGTGGLGLSLARHLLRSGAKNIALLSRSSEAGSALSDSLREIHDQANIKIYTCDVSDAEALERVAVEVSKQLAPIGGIYHLAGGIVDSSVETMSQGDIEAVFNGKVFGAWNLHRLALKVNPQRFVLFSSAAVLMNSGNQANYVAANSFLDALSAYRQAHGQPATSINFGLFTEVGILSKQEGLKFVLDLQGIRGLVVNDALKVMDCFIEDGVVSGGYVNIDFDKYLAMNQEKTASHYWTRLGSSKGMQVAFESRYNASLALENISKLKPRKREKMLSDFVKAQVSKLTGMKPSTVDNSQPFSDMGMDSITSLKLQKSLEEAIGIKVSSTLIWKYAYLDELVRAISDQCASDSNDRSVMVDCDNVDVANRYGDHSESDKDDGGGVEDDLVGQLLAEVQKH
ncbi:SDR family NAD(P)-dependent oxidoreductase [Bacterioplanoides sp.]|uniref:SDR family NAD(P)-dependent oxidoreductase n=1 Tax=Bacterioplanoides sp. TaxID=2066072 RepID=UPI003B5C316D